MSTREMILGMINDLDDEQTEAVYLMLKLILKAGRESTLSESQKAFETIERLRKPFTGLGTDDYRTLYREEMEKKYEGLD